MVRNGYDVTDGVVIGGDTLKRKYTLVNGDGEQQAKCYARSDASALREFKERCPYAWDEGFQERYGPYEMRCY